MGGEEPQLQRQFKRTRRDLRFITVITNNQV